MWLVDSRYKFSTNLPTWMIIRLKDPNNLISFPVEVTCKGLIFYPHILFIHAYTKISPYHIILYVKFKIINKV